MNTITNIILYSQLLLLSNMGCSKSSSDAPGPDSGKNQPTEVAVRANYYVDGANGNDNNDGTKTAPWKSLSKINAKEFKAGDSILLKAGSSWVGQLVLKGSGKAGSSIVVSSYGEGSKPHIKGEGTVNQVILLEEADNWTISNIELSNQAAEIGNRTGILIRSLSDGLKQNFRIANVYIHDVMGDYSFEMKGKNTGGIGIIGGPGTKFDNIVIEDSEIGPVNRVGIFTNLTDAKNAIKGNRPISNLVIRRNKIHHCSGDGAIIRYANKPVIAHNVAYENHNAPENLVDHGVALWCRSTDEALFEYNEVYHTRGSQDGQAFDADLDAYRTVIQYNYSHDNEGGFMLVYGSSSDAIVRYNISVNDGKLGKHIFDFPTWTSPRGSGIFHNNTVIIPQGVDAVIADEALETARFYNNIFYNMGAGKPVIRSGGKTALFNNNSFTGYQSIEIPETSPLLSDPQLLSPLTSPAPLGLVNTGGFKLGPNSPYGSSGVSVRTREPAYWLSNEGTIDFSGKTLPGAVPIGAYLK